MNWSPADLARALEATRAEVEGWEAGLWRPREPALKLLEMLEKGSALYYSAVDDSDEGCPLWHPLRAESAAAARAEAEKAHFQAAGENKPRIILAENRALKSRRNEDAGFRVVAVWSEKRGWMDSD
ncbi:MAG: hypothetical protein LBC90_02070 [Candidatus Adiutrix sp.]|nr:hypothetical protein [Candidatus Adiutrix sp.]